MWSPQLKSFAVYLRLKIRARQANHRSIGKQKRSAYQRHFQRRRPGLIFEQQIPQPQRHRIRRTRCRNSQHAVSLAAKILHRRL